jgi:hypothetical protein
MKKPTEFTFTDTAAGAGVRTPAKRQTAKSARTSKQLASAARGKRRSRATRKLRRASSIRETEEARALLEKQLHSLYWWVFNAFKMKGFIRAKALDQLQRDGANGSKTRTEQNNFVEAPISPKKQTL